MATSVLTNSKQIMKRKKSSYSSKVDGASLRNEYEKMVYVLKALGGGVWEFDIASGALSCSRRWHEILGLNYDTQRVRSLDEFKPHIHPDDVGRATKVDMGEINRLIAQDERYAIDFRIIHQDGEPRWIRSVATLVADAARKFKAFGCITDVTPLIVSRPSLHESGMGVGKRSRKFASLTCNKQGATALSNTEIECLRWVSLGKTAKETAVILGKSARTIEFHLNNAMKKLNAVNKVQAVVLAVGLNLL